MHTLLLHIGTSKTGTTALQDFLFQSSEILKKFGWIYPDLCRDWTSIMGKRKFDHDEKNGQVLVYSLQKARWKKKRIWQIIKNYLKYYNVIISDEAFSEISTIIPEYSVEDMLKEFTMYYKKIKVIIYLRRQDLYIESFWNQIVKENMYDSDLKKFYESKTVDIVANYLAILKQIKNVIGKENIIVRIYERDKFVRGNIFSDFIMQICPELTEILLWELRLERNTSLDGDTLAIRRLFNKTYKLYYRGLSEVAESVFIRSQSDNLGGHTYLSKSQKENIKKKYEADNAIIAKEYLKRADGGLFFDTSDSRSYYTEDFSERERYIINLAGEICARQQKIIDEFYSMKIKDYLYKAISMLILYLGAGMRRVFAPIIIYMKAITLAFQGIGNYMGRDDEKI